MQIVKARIMCAECPRPQREGILEKGLKGIWEGRYHRVKTNEIMLSCDQRKQRGLQGRKEERVE